MSSVIAAALRARADAQEQKASVMAVGRTSEFRRVEALPRRSEVLDLRDSMTELLKSPHGTMRLNFEQAWALSELFEQASIEQQQQRAGGLLAGVEAGGGKTLIGMLAPTVIQLAWKTARPGERVRAVKIVPANLRNHKTLKIDVPFYGQHWQIYDWHEGNVLSYEMLGRAEYAEILDRILPNVIVFDEVHKIKNQKAAVSTRVLRYLERYPDTAVVSMTATFTKEAVEDFGHISRITLGAGSPVPTHDSELRRWGKVLNHGLSDSERLAPGALWSFCQEGETPRDGFRRRLQETPGVVLSRESELTTGLVIRERTLKAAPPAQLGTMLVDMVRTMKTPSDDIIVSGLELARHKKELAAGFYYRWLWPNNKPDLEWLAARKAWRKFVRKCIQSSGLSTVKGLLLDSEKQVRNAVVDRVLECDEDQWHQWEAIRDRCDPRVQAVWVSEFLLDEIERWMDESKEPGLVWVSHNAILNKLRERGRLVYGGGQDEVVHETRTCVVSLPAHKEGKNLQAFSRNLYVIPPQSGLDWEQSLARTHRTGQQADEVSVEVCLHSLDLWLAFREARAESKYVAELTGSKPRLQRATIDVPTEEEVLLRTQTTTDPLWMGTI